MLQPYRAVLSRPGALRFSSAGALARLPMSMIGLGIVLMVSELEGSYGLAGRVTAVEVVAQSICSPQLARLVDRHGQARVMRPAVVVTAVGLCAMIGAAVLHAAPWSLYLAAAVTGASIGSIGSLVRARWSAVLRGPREIHTAYSLESAVDEGLFVVGPVLVTVLAIGVHPSAGLMVSAVAVVGGGLLLLSQRATEPATRPDDLGRRSRHVMGSAGMAVLFVVFICIGAIYGALNVSTVAFAEEHGHKAAAGAVLAVTAVGSTIAGLIYGSRQWQSPLWRRFAIGVVALALGVSLLSLITSLAVLAAVMFVIGFAIAPSAINGNALVEELVPRHQLTEGLTWLGTGMGVGVSLGSWTGGTLIDSAGSHAGFLVVMVCAGLAAVAVLASLRTLRAGRASVASVASGARD